MKINPIGHLVKTNPIKPNLRKAKMKLKFYSTKDYENETALGLWENKANQSQFPKSQNEVKLLFNKGL